MTLEEIIKHIKEFLKKIYRTEIDRNTIFIGLIIIVTILATLQHLGFFVRPLDPRLLYGD